MSITSGRSFGRFPLVGVLESDPASWRRRARGNVDRSASSTSISSEDIEDAEPAEDLLRRFAGRAEDCAHSGTGFNSSNCLRSLFVYSLPLITSSLSLTRSFRSRVQQEILLAGHRHCPPKQAHLHLLKPRELSMRSDRGLMVPNQGKRASQMSIDITKAASSLPLHHRHSPGRPLLPNHHLPTLLRAPDHSPYWHLHSAPIAP